MFSSAFAWLRFGRRLVENGPKGADMSNGADEIPVGHVFDHLVVNAQMVARPLSGGGKAEAGSSRCHARASWLQRVVELSRFAAGEC